MHHCKLIHHDLNGLDGLVLMGPPKITPIPYGEKRKMLLLPRFFFMGWRVPENGLDKIARRSKRVGGAIADSWGSHLVGTSRKVELHRKKHVPWTLLYSVPALQIYS